MAREASLRGIRAARTSVVEGGGVGQVGQALPVVGEEAVGAQLAADGHRATSAQLAPHAARDGQAGVARHTNKLDAVRPLRLPRICALVPVPVPGAPSHSFMRVHLLSTRVCARMQYLATICTG